MPPRQSARAKKKPDDAAALQLRWDEFVADFDRGGARNADAVTKFLTDDTNRNWPSLKLGSLHVAYTHLGMKRPLPQGKPGFVAAITTHLQSTAPSGQRPTGVVDSDVDEAEDGAPRSSSSSPLRTSNEARPSVPPATTTAPSPTSSTTTSTTSTTTSGTTTATAPVDTLAGASGDVKNFFAGFMTEWLERLSTAKDRPSAAEKATSLSSQPTSTEKVVSNKRHKVSNSDNDSDSDAGSDTEHTSSSRDSTNKYVDSCLATLKFHNVTLSQHIDNYEQKVGWNNKRHRHEAVEIARIYDAAMTESMDQVKRRLIARYVALEEFDSTGNPEVFEHVQASGYSILGNSVKHELHRAVKRSALGTTADSTHIASRRPRKHQHHNNSKNYNNNNNNHNNNNQQQQQQQHNNGGGGGHGRRGNNQNNNNNNNNNRPVPNGQGAANQAVAGQQ